MNILVIGGMCSLINQLIKKLKKEGHRVHLLTGNRYKLETYEKVFERYDITYDSECLIDVFESVNPDVTIFMGAFDTNFRWTNEQREMVRFTSSLTNFLTAYSMTGKGRFIYLTSEVVYSENYDSDISEDTETSPSDMKGMALAQGEDICKSFVRIRESDIVVLRLDHYYKIPKDLSDADDLCSQMCIEAMRKGIISANARSRFSLLYEPDAVEFIYQIVRCEKHQHSVYNLSSSSEVTEKELARYIQESMSDYTRVTVEDSEAEDRRCVLSNKRFDNEFGIRIFAVTPKVIDQLVKYMTDNDSVFLTGEQKKKSLWQRISEKAGWLIRAIIPYLENIIFFFIFFFLNSISANSQFFSRLDFYLLYVLLFAVVHGQQQATFSAIFAVIGYFFTQTSDRSLLSVALDYNMYIWIAQLFIVGLVVGYMKDQIRKLRNEAEEERQYLSLQLSDIKDINGSNVRVKDALETQIVNQSDSIGKIYAITSKLEKYTPEEVLFYAAEIVREFLGSKDIAVYTISNNDYARLFTFTSDKAKILGKSIRYRELGEVYETLASKKVFINRTLDDRYPMMSTAIFDRDDMQIMIMAWGIPWERMTLGQADMLMIVSYLIQNAVLRAARYITMLENRRYQEGKLVMEQDAFTSLVHVFLEARDKHLTECVMLRLIIPENMSEIAERAEIPVQVQSSVRSESASRLEGRTPVVKKPQAEAINKQVKNKGILNSVQGLLHLRHIDSIQQQQPANRQKPVEAQNEPVAAAPVAVKVPVEAASDSSSRYEKIAQALVGKIRNTDYVGVLEDGNMYVLLCNTNNEEASFAVNRIQSSGLKCVLLEDFKI